MSDADIEKAVKEAAEFEAQDKKRKENIDEYNDAQATVTQVEKALEDAGSQIGESDKANVEADLKTLKEAIGRAPIDQATDDQIADIKAAKEKLMNSMQPLAQKIYEQAQAQQAAGAGQQGAGPQGGYTEAQPGNGGQAPYGDDVVDGDFKEV